MTLEEIRELIALAKEHDLAEIEFERDGTRVRIKRPITEHQVTLPATPLPVPANVPPPGPRPAAPPTPGTQAMVPARPSAPPVGESIVYVKAPIVGTYFESPSPGAPVFVKPGDRVSKGQILCIIESMKLMNEIESEVSGVVVQKIAANAAPVGYGEPLLAVRTD
jgi:acetyl-CoA carboxylase biotin carboxyl carrier protein